MTNARIAILPRELASELITASVARGAWIVAVVIVVLDFPVLIDVLAERGVTAALPIPLTALVALVVLLVFVGWRTALAARLLYLSGAFASALLYTVSLLAADPDLVGDKTYLLNRAAIVLILIGPGVMRPVRGFLWSAVGLVLAIAVMSLASAITGTPFDPGWGPFTSWAVYATVYLTLSIIKRSQASAVPNLERLEEETRRMEIENQFEQRAAAMIHDTVLGDLTAVMNSNGALDERAREKFRSDVATLKNPTWLREGDEVVLIDDRDSALRNGSVALVSEMQWRGLTVDVTGSNDAVVRLSPAATAAVHGALRASLENVLAHAGVRSAQVVTGGSDRELTYMIIDHGVGFDPDAVPLDRLGLRESVVGRIEANGGSVRIWSSPGSGTSIILSMPIGAENA